MTRHTWLSLVATLALAVGRTASGAETNHNFDKWEKEISAFEQMDRTNPPPQGALLFIGSSNIRLWKSLAQDFPEHRVINRGFGGSQIVDSTHFAERIIFPYAPRVIYLRAGGNDLWAGKSPEEVFQDFKDFVEKVHAKLADAQMVFVSLSPSIARWKQADKEKALNSLVEQFVRTKPYLGYIETYPIVFGPDGQPRPELFVADKLHFNADGYKLLAERVRAFLPKATKASTNGPSRAAAPASKPTVPAVLPGKGLAQHDFFYAGEAKTRDMYIVRKGQVVWAYHDAAGRGEISDAVLLSSGNVLFAHQYAVTLITPDQKVIWNHDAPAQCEIHTAQPIGTNRVIFIQNGPEPKVFVANLATGQMEREFPLPVGNAKSTHGQFRHARLTDAGTYLVAHMDMRKVAEYDETGRQVWSAEVPGAWSAVRLKNGNTLVCGKVVREINPSGETVWEFTPGDVPDYKFDSMQLATRLPNGNTLINHWVNQWSGKIDPATAPAQVLEVTPAKQIVWALRSWTNPDLGPSTTIQLLDEPSVPEAVHFGSIK